MAYRRMCVVQVVEEVSREGEVTSSNPADRVAANFARKMLRALEALPRA
jgi:hypothetical protein